MISEEQIYSLKEFKDFLLKHTSSNAALVYGGFHIIHPGHLRYFERARSYGESLVVALAVTTNHSGVQDAEQFPVHYRAVALARLPLVDQVIILDSGNLNDLLGFFEPPTLILGNEFEADRASEVHDATTRIISYGGQVIYQAGDISYSTSMIGLEYDETERANWNTLTTTLLAHDIDIQVTAENAKSRSQPKALVIGDTILDQYVACDPIGLSREAPVVVVKELELQPFLGGAAIVAAHLTSLGATTTFISVIGNDNEADTVRAQLKTYDVNHNLLVDESRPTTLKTRYLVNNQKLFRVSRLREHPLSKNLEEKFIAMLYEKMPQMDIVVVSDFVYGMITDRIVSTLLILSELHHVPICGDLQCSSQIGNITKFKNFHLLCPTEREARIALGDSHNGLEVIAHKLMDITSTNNLILKLGGDGFIAYQQQEGDNDIARQYFPALSVRPADVTGAGDSLLATVAYGLGVGFTMFEAAALSTCSAAISVQTVGNIPVSFNQISTFIKQRKLLESM